MTIERDKIPRKSRRENYNDALNLFLNGEINGALFNLTENRIELKVGRYPQHSNDEKRVIAKSWLLRANILALQADFSHAEISYRKALLFGPDFFDAKVSYAIFHQSRNNFEKARVGYEESLILAQQDKNEANQAVVSNNLGIVYSRTGRLKEAHDAFARSLAIRKRLVNSDSKDSSEQLQYVATVLNNIDALYEGEEKFKMASDAYNESLNIFEKLAQQDSARYLPNVATLTFNLGNIRKKESGLLDDAKLVVSPIQISRSPHLYNGDYLLDPIGLDEADRVFDKALVFYRVLAQREPTKFQGHVAKVLFQQGILAIAATRYVDGHKAIEASHAIYVKLAGDDENFKKEIDACQKLLSEISKIREE